MVQTNLTQLIHNLIHGDVDARLDAITSLGISDAPGTTGAISTLLDDHAYTTSARLMAVQLLSTRARLSCVDALMIAIETDAEPRVRRAAQHALNRMITNAPHLWSNYFNHLYAVDQRIRWLAWAHRQHLPWCAEVVAHALEDTHYINNIGLLPRLRYQRALHSFQNTKHGVPAPAIVWATSATHTTDALRAKVLTRYGAQKHGALARARGHTKTTFVQNSVGYFEIASGHATLFLRKTKLWSLDLARPITADCYIDRTDAPLSNNRTASVHILLPQPDGIERGLSVHVHNTPELDALPTMRNTFPYIHPAQAEQLCGWLSVHIHPSG